MVAIEPAPGHQDDIGLCLTLHQPWASLLCWGVKRIEGRGWHIRHRGILWIHAGSKRPDPLAIQDMEQLYKRLHKEDGAGSPVFPSSYPTGVLVGCVRVVNCLQAEEVEAWEGLPQNVKEEVGSAHCALCEEPQYMPVPVPMRGHQGLWYLDQREYHTARARLRPAPQGDGLQQRICWGAFPPPPDASRQWLPRSRNVNNWKDRYHNTSPTRQNAERQQDQAAITAPGAQQRAQAAQPVPQKRRAAQASSTGDLSDPWPALGAPASQHQHAEPAPPPANAPAAAPAGSWDGLSDEESPAHAPKRQHAYVSPPRQPIPGDWDALFPTETRQQAASTESEQASGCCPDLHSAEQGGDQGVVPPLEAPTAGPGQRTAEAAPASPSLGREAAQPSHSNAALQFLPRPLSTAARPSQRVEEGRSSKAHVAPPSASLVRSCDASVRQAPKSYAAALGVRVGDGN